MQKTEEIAPSAEQACQLAPNEEIIHRIYLWRSRPTQGAYTFSMGKICVMLKGTEKPCIVNGSDIQEGTGPLGNRVWVVKNDKNEIVGTFHWDAVLGWWKGEE
jgi:hypothetical protein